jgi:hypothetical protein
MAGILDHLDVLDRPHRPLPGSPELPTYKEWYHFNLLDDAAGIDTIVNLSLTGDPYRPDQGDANLIMLMHRRGQGWTGGLDQHDGLAAMLDDATTDIRIGRSRLVWENGAFALEAGLRDGSLTLDCRLVPMSEPMLIWKDTPIGSGRLNWLILPWLEAAGRLSIAGAAHEFEAVRAYHDHNWGHWRWGENFGWDWGFSARLGRAPDGEFVTIVYDRTTDRQRSLVQEHTLALWKGGALLKLFTRRSLDQVRSGRFAGEPVVRIPGAMNLANPGLVLSVPARIGITAKDGTDWLEAEYRVEAARQVAIPADLGFGTVELNETFGRITVAGHVDGLPIGLDGRACFEFVA